MISNATEPVKVVANIIQTMMGIDNAHIFLDFQNLIIPQTGMFVVLDYLGPSETISNQGYFDPSTNTEVQEVSVRHTIQIDICSIMPDTSARIRRYEIPLALRSFYSQQQQEENLIGIAWIQSDFVNNTSLEETAMMQRYTTTCAVNALFQKTIPSNYFDQFGIELVVSDKAGREEIVSIDPAVSPQER